MIRVLSPTHCQVLHRKTTHEIMLEAIEGVEKIKPASILDALLPYEAMLLSDMEHILPTGVKHPKLTILILIASEYSYFDGMYRRRNIHSATGKEAYTKAKAFIGEYLSKL